MCRTLFEETCKYTIFPKFLSDMYLHIKADAFHK
ncbi:hypothetical protein SJDPG11_09135 [Porphyromonas gingivalis SJD11]|nr:hypothetical protein SJDPG11_09135 [Porphyromonas gingivalis SJD11]